MEPSRAPPADFDALQTALVDKRSRLPPRLIQVATYAMAHPDEVAFGTAASVAEAAQVQASTLVRFAQALGYAGFSELQRVFRNRLRRRWPEYRERLAALQHDGEERGAAGLLEGFTQSSVASLDKLRETIRPADLEAAAGLLAAADTIHLLGLRRAFPVAAYLAYALAKLDLRCVLVDGVGGLAGEQLGRAGPADVLLAISFTPYTPVTVDLANASADRNVPVVAITDSPFSPLAPRATVRFDVVEADFGAFRSLAATFSLAISLAVAAAGLREARSGAETNGSAGLRGLGGGIR